MMKSVLLVVLPMESGKPYVNVIFVVLCECSDNCCYIWYREYILTMKCLILLMNGTVDSLTNPLAGSPVSDQGRYLVMTDLFTYTSVYCYIENCVKLAKLTEGHNEVQDILKFVFVYCLYNFL